MTLECKRLINHVTGHPMDKSPWLTVGRQYVALGVTVTSRRGIQFRVMSDDGHTPGLEDSRQFDVLSTAIPPDWAAIVNQNEFYLGPREFQKPGFWEAFFDRKPEAVQTFSEVWERLRDWAKARSGEPTSGTEYSHTAQGSQHKVDELLNRLIGTTAFGQDDSRIHQAMAGVALTPEELEALGNEIRDVIRRVE